MDNAAARALIERLATRDGDLSVKGKASRYLAVNGNMFAFAPPEGGFAFRVSPAERADWAADGHDDGPVIQYGKVMRDYVWVPDALAADEAALGRWFARATTYARSLKPKPTKR